MSDRPGHPRWVYGKGDEPDPRFSFANERTFLAWIRTALALLAAGVALGAVDLAMSDFVRDVISHGLIVLGIACPPLAWLRWARSERAMRLGQPLPAFNLAGAATLAMTVLAMSFLLVTF